MFTGYYIQLDLFLLRISRQLAFANSIIGFIGRVQIIYVSQFVLCKCRLSRKNTELIIPKHYE